MSDSDPGQQPPDSKRPPGDEAEVEPSWKPLYWVLGSLALVIGLGEILLELGFHLLDFLMGAGETVYLALVEAPEELLEDQIENWLEQHFPHDAGRYSEIVTAVGLTPVKILLGLLLARWLWRKAHSEAAPRIEAYIKRQYRSVLLAWKLLAWPYKALIGLVVFGSLFLVI
jgi:hypothetical protein